MKNMKHNGIMRLALAAMTVAIMAGEAECVWIWTRERGWWNPKYAALETAEEQYELAKGLEGKKEYDKAVKEYRKVPVFFKDSKLAPLALYRVGVILDEQGYYYEAFTAFQEAIDEFPQNDMIEDINAKEYEIAERFFGGMRRRMKWTGLRIIPSLDKAVEIYKKVTENSPYGKSAPDAQYKLGLCQKQRGKFREAIDEFRKVVEDYSETKASEKAKFEIADCYLKMSLEASYDQKEAKEASEEFNEFVKSYPGSELADDAAGAARELKEREASKVLEVASFYESRGNSKAALIYYQELFEGYPDSEAAQKARESKVARGLKSGGSGE